MGRGRKQKRDGALKVNSADSADALRPYKDTTPCHDARYIYLCSR